MYQTSQKKLINAIIIITIVFGVICPTQAKPYLLEAESFTEWGGWVLDQQSMDVDVMGSPYLLAHGLGSPVKNARTEINLQLGTYRVWVRNRDWVGNWKKDNTPTELKAEGYPGVFEVLLNNKAIETKFGNGKSDWYWQDGGKITISQKKVVVELHDLTGFEGRCDAVLFNDDFNSVPPEKPQELKKFRRNLLGTELPENGGNFDLVVTGGGIAGSSAAVCAARNGLRVAFIQDRPVIGGNNSSEVRVWLSGRTDSNLYPELGRVTKEFEQKKRAHYGKDNTAEIYEDQRKLDIIKAEKRITLFMNTHVTDVESHQGRIEAVIGENIITGKRTRISGSLFVDSTGHGTVGFLAGANYEMSSDLHMGSSNLWHCIDTGKLSPFPSCPWALNLKDRMFPGRDPNDTNDSEKRLLRLGGWYWESGCNWEPIQNAEIIRDWNFRAMYGAWDCLKNIDKQYVNYKLNWAAYISGPRESRRLMGDVVLTKEDLVNSRTFEDGCVMTSWRIDLHEPHPNYKYGPFEKNAFITKAFYTKYPMPFYIPYRCLYSRNILNLFMAGRDISVTHEALGTVRVMRTGGLMGEVTAYAATLCEKYNCNPRDVYEKYLPELKELLRKGYSKKK